MRAAFSWFGNRRIILLPLLAVGWVMAMQITLAAALQRANPTLAVRINPWNAIALAERANQLVTRQPEDAQARGQAIRSAKAALRRSPINARAAVTLGLANSLGGDPREAAAWVGYSERLSRRELAAQLWLIESAVARGDVDTALQHYDIAIRTGRQARELLFPVLAAAAADGNVRQKLAAWLAKRPPWGEAFLFASSGSTSDPLSLAALYQETARRGAHYSPGSGIALVQRLAVAREFAAALGVYDVLYRTAGQPVHDPAFREIKDLPTVFDWTLTASGDLTAGASGAPGGLIYMARPGASGLLARQTVRLAAGRWRLGMTLLKATPADIGPILRLTCFEGQVLASMRLMRRSTGHAAIQADIPAGCSTQWLDLLVDAADSALPVEGGTGPLLLKRIDRGSKASHAVPAVPRGGNP